jgi:hypothetical protein
VLIKTDNAAFEDGRDAELARILREIADGLDEGVSAGNVRDINGNTVGDFGARIDGTMP